MYKDKKNISAKLTLPFELSTVYSEVDGLSLQNLFYASNGYFPSCQMFYEDSRGDEYVFDTEKILNYLIDNTDKDDFQFIVYNSVNLSSSDDRLAFCGVLRKSNLFFRVEKSVSESYILYDYENKDAVANLTEIFKKFYIEPEKEPNNLYRIAITNGNFHLVSGKVRDVKNFSVSKHYNDDFQKEYDKIENFIKKEDKGGLVILHGEKGTGKSTYIRHMINLHPEKRFIFVPAAIISMLGDPSFATFLQSLSNDIVILEDCENAIKDRKTSGSGAAVSLLLNMTDGLLEDDLGIKFVCTFNEDTKNIDQALLRKGRLVSKYEFKSLSQDKTNALLDELYPEETHNEKGMTLSDIFNYNEDSYEEKKTRII